MTQSISTERLNEMNNYFIYHASFESNKSTIVLSESKAKYYELNEIKNYKNKIFKSY